MVDSGSINFVFDFLFFRREGFYQPSFSVNSATFRLSSKTFLSSKYIFEFQKVNHQINYAPLVQHTLAVIKKDIWFCTYIPICSALASSCVSELICTIVNSDIFGICIFFLLSFATLIELVVPSSSCDYIFSLSSSKRSFKIYVSPAGWIFLQWMLVVFTVNIHMNLQFNYY